MQIVYHAHINNTGYSISAQDYILAMLNVDNNVNIRLEYLNLKTHIGVSKKRQQIFTELNNKPKDQNVINVFHSIPSRYKPSKGKGKSVGFCIFETINPPPFWINKMNEMDLIITASQFNKNVFEANGAKVPIVVIPHCFDVGLFNHNVRPNGRYATKTIMSIGTWKARKNWDQLIRGFYDAFEKKDNVCLLLKTDKLKELQHKVISIKKEDPWSSKDTAPIFAEQTPMLTFEDIPALMKKSDYFVSASLGEGFGLPPFQAMALGIPICVTKFGGSLEYAREGLAHYFTPASFQTQPTMDGIPQFNKCVWPVLKTSEISTKLREIINTDNRKMVADGYKYVHENYNYNKIGSQFLKALENV